MQHFTLTLDVATLNPNQHKALIALVESLQAPYFIPTADENEDKLTSEEFAGTEITDDYIPL